MSKVQTGGNGFTLIELLIVIAIIGILSAIAVPAYGDYVRRGKIQEATAGLGDQRVKLEQYFLDNRTYTGGSGTWKCGTPAPNAANFRYFTFSCESTASTYTVTATGKSAEGMGGFSYAVNESNVRSSTFTGLSGWNNSATCWVGKKGETC